MWLFTDMGFVSIVTARTGDGSRKNPVDPERLQVRAYRREHLEHLIDLMPELQEYPILATPRADYRFRIVVPRDIVPRLLAKLGEGISYDNFKNRASRSGVGRDYVSVLFRVHDEAQRLIADRRSGRPGSLW